MGFVAGQITLGSTGTTNIAHGLGATPIGARFTVTKGSGVDNDEACFSVGVTDGSYERVDAQYSANGNPGVARNITSTSKCVATYRDTGSISEVLGASFDSWDSTYLTLDVDNANSNYSVRLEIWS